MSVHVQTSQMLPETNIKKDADKSTCGETLEHDFEIRALIRDKEIYDRRWLQQREQCFGTNTARTPWCRL